MSRNICIWTDGSAWPNPNGAMGWAFVARYYDQVTERSSYAPVGDGHSNNVAELTAIVRALEFIKPGRTEPINIYTDSKYAYHAATKWGDMWKKSGWLTSTGKPVCNPALILRLRWLLKQHRRTRSCNLHWVKGHADTADNNVADALANQARITQSGTWQATDSKFPAAEATP